MNPQILADLRNFRPEVILTVSFLCVILGDIAFARIRNRITFILSLTGFGLALAASVSLFGLPERTLFYGMVALDPMGAFFKCFLIVTSIFVLLAIPGSKELSRHRTGEFYALLLGVTLAMLLLASSVDMLMLYLSLEMVSLGSYIMVGYLKNNRQSNEASLKYLLFGAVATGCMLYGITLLYGMTGTTKLFEIREVLAGSVAFSGNSGILLLSTTLILAGFGFKTAAVPFHFWCPDVYSGAPTPVTAFLSVAPKAAGFAALIRFFFTGLSKTSINWGYWTQLGIDWSLLVLIISIITMTFGNIAALRQTNIKRLLAYSSIAHAGYIFMGAVVLTSQGLQAILIYLITYLFMNLGAFLVIIEINNQTGSFDLKDYQGFYRKSPFLTIAMAIFMLSLMGMPPFAGFFGKLYVFGAAIHRDLAWFAVVGALNSVIAVYYYARVIKTMVMDPSENMERLAIPWSGQIIIWILLFPTAGILFFWSRIQEWTAHSAKLLLGN
jgi:NADH-quinone oxidoreductase subunit N